MRRLAHGLGGSRTYVDAVVERLGETLCTRPASPVSAIRRGSPYRVERRARRFDRVVIATHPDQALRLLDRPVGAPRPVGASTTRATRRCCTPTPRCCRARAAARASWNYLMEDCTTRARSPCHLPPEPPAGVARAGRLLRHPEPDRPDRAARRDPRFTYEHPIYTLDSLEAQRRLPAISGAQHRLLRRLPRLGVPRGRLRVGPAGGAVAGVRVVSGSALYEGR